MPVAFAGKRNPARALRLLLEAGVTGLVSRPPTLEQLFMRHYGERR